MYITYSYIYIYVNTYVRLQLSRQTKYTVYMFNKASKTVMSRYINKTPIFYM